MATESGNPKDALGLLWGGGHRPGRGPRPTLTVERIVAAALEIADTEGLESLSMRRVAARLSVGTASLYTYVPGKDELLALMLDELIGSDRLPHRRPGTWREKLQAWARADWRGYRAHPWAVRLASLRRPAGPNAMAWLDSALSVLGDTALSEREMLAAIGALDGYVRGQARRAISAAEAERPVGENGESWQEIENAYLSEHVDFRPYPMLRRIAEADASAEPEFEFEFGLQRMLDGLEALIERRRPQGDG